MNGDFSNANTGVFWDMEDSPIPDDCDPSFAYQKIKSAITSKKIRKFGAVDIWAYGEKNKVWDEFLLAGITVVPAGDERARDKKMIVDILFWALDNPSEHLIPQNVMVISKNISQDKELLSILQILEWRGYNVLLVDSADYASANQIKFVSYVWSWQDLLFSDQSESSHGFANKREREGGSQYTAGISFEAVKRDCSNANTGVFWDMEDSPIPDDCHPFFAYQKIKSAITCKGFRKFGAVDIRAYGDKNKVRDEFLHAGIMVVPAGDQRARNNMMILDIIFWALANPAEDPIPQNVMVISKNISQDKELLSILQILEWRDYNILLVDSADFAPANQIRFVSYVWSWRNLFSDQSDGFANKREGGSQEIDKMPEVKKSKNHP